MAAKILLIDDEEYFIKTLRNSFAGSAGDDCVEWVTSIDGRSGIQAFRDQGPFDAVLVDVHLPDMSGLDVAALIRRIRPDQQIIFCTGDESKITLSGLLSSGLGNGFLPKFDKSASLIEPIQRALKNFKRNLAILSDETPVAEDSDVKNIKDPWAGTSKALNEIRRLTKIFRSKPGSVLILGETGAGKESVAHALAQTGQSILAINCAKFVDNPQLIESELFGSVKGAYTGAVVDRPGVFESARGGIVFLDEIHLLPLSAQNQILRVIEDKKVKRMGETSGKEKSVQFRLVCAGQPTLLGMRETGTFKRDLYYRIATLRIDVPALRDRKEDVEPIATALIANYSRELRLQKSLRSGTVRLMEEYSWPGNVRELRLAVERMVSTVRGKIIEPQDFVNFLDQEATRQINTSQPLAELSHHAYMQLKETEYFKELLLKSSTQTEAAKKAGLSSSTFYFRLKKLGIQIDDLVGRLK
jgi:DNA-binding NtrC family response regulator